MRKVLLALVAASIFAIPTLPQACPNASSSITIPTSGSSSLNVYDPACNVLAGPWTVYNGVNNAGLLLNSTTAPSVNTIGGILQFAANGAPVGSGGSLHIVFMPNGVSQNITFSVGVPVTSISFGTTTP